MQMVLHNYHHINISSHVIFLFGDNGFYGKHLKDASLSSRTESKNHIMKWS